MLCSVSLFGKCSGVLRRPTDTVRPLKKGRQTNCCSICRFRCHLFLCVYLACCHVGLPRAVQPSSSSGSGGRVERPPCSPVTQHRGGRPSPADQGQRSRRNMPRAREPPLHVDFSRWSPSRSDCISAAVILFEESEAANDVATKH